jgi:hypothetical protein
MEDKITQIESNGISYDVGFEENNIYCQLINYLKETPINQLAHAILKKTSLGSGNERSFRLIYQENMEKEKAPWIQSKITILSAPEFSDENKDRLPTTVISENYLDGFVRYQEFTVHG